MDKNELPARVLSDSGLLFHDDVPPVVLRTFARLYALAWKYHYDRTDRLTTDELLVLLDVTMRSLYRHLAALRKLGVLEWASDGQYGYIFTFPRNHDVPLADDGADFDKLSRPEPESTELVEVGEVGEVSEVSRVELAEVGPTLPEPITAKNSSPAAKNGSPTAKVGSPAAKNGGPATRNSSPDAKVGSPSAKIGSPAAKTSSPANRNSSPANRNSSPDAKIGSPTAKNSSQKHPVVVVDHLYPDRDLNKQQQQLRENRGSPTARSGSPTARSGSPTARSGSPTARSGNPTARSGSPTARSGNPTAKTSSPTALGLWPEPITAKPGSPTASGPGRAIRPAKPEPGTARIDNRAAAGRRRRPGGGQHRSWPELETALTQAGMWHDLAQDLTARLDVDGVLDALGWIAAVRADRRVRNHGAVLVNHLQAGRRAPPNWRPAALCAGCGVVEDRCTCGGRRRVVPGVYYTAAIEPVNAWGRDAWGVCQTCGRVACAGHDQVGEGVIHWAASNGSGGSENSSENRIRRAWPAVAEFIRQRYGIEIKPVEIGDYEVKVTFPSGERGAVVNWVRSMLSREVRGFVEVIDAGPV